MAEIFSSLDDHGFCRPVKEPAAHINVHRGKTSGSRLPACRRIYLTGLMAIAKKTTGASVPMGQIGGIHRRIQICITDQSYLTRDPRAVIQVCNLLYVDDRL